MCDFPQKDIETQTVKWDLLIVKCWQLTQSFQLQKHPLGQEKHIHGWHPGYRLHPAKHSWFTIFGLCRTALRKVKSPFFTHKFGKHGEIWYKQLLPRKWSNRKTHPWLLGVKTGTATLENKLVASCKDNDMHIWLPSSSIPRHTLPGNCCTCAQRNIWECS